MHVPESPFTQPSQRVTLEVRMPSIYPPRETERAIASFLRSLGGAVIFVDSQPGERD